MCRMSKLREDFSQYNLRGLSLLFSQGLIASCLVVVSSLNLFTINTEPFLVFIGLGLLLVIASSRLIIELPGTHSHISLMEVITFLAIISLSPYHAVLLTLIDMVLTNRRAKCKPSLFIFNISNHIISVFAAAQTYYVVKSFLVVSFATPNANERMLVFALPLVLMAIAYNFFNVGSVTVMSYIKHQVSLRKTISETLPWEQVTLI